MPGLAPSNFLAAMNVPGAGAAGGRFLPATPLATLAGAGALPSLVGVLERVFAGLAEAGEAATFAGLALRDGVPFLIGVPIAFEASADMFEGGRLD